MRGIKKRNEAELEERRTEREVEQGKNEGKTREGIRWVDMGGQ